MPKRGPIECGGTCSSAHAERKDGLDKVKNFPHIRQVSSNLFLLPTREDDTAWVSLQVEAG